jgi:hypothetical protein
MESNGKPSNINTLSLNKSLTTEYLLLTKQYSECSHTFIIQVILHKVSKLQDITESLRVKNAIINICPNVICYTTMSTLRHKHGCNQEFYNMHVLSYCTNKKKVMCQITPQRQISVSVNLFYNICQATHNTRNKVSNYRIYWKARRGFFP